jgi:hypothetical protein
MCAGGQIRPAVKSPIVELSLTVTFRNPYERCILLPSLCETFRELRSDQPRLLIPEGRRDGTMFCNKHISQFLDLKSITPSRSRAERHFCDGRHISFELWMRG